MTLSSINSCFLLHPSIVTHPIKSFSSLAKLSYLVILFPNTLGGENLSQAPLELGMIENQHVGKRSSRIKKIDCENPLATIR
jgi:hypothetical protein